MLYIFHVNIGNFRNWMMSVCSVLSFTALCTVSFVYRLSFYVTQARPQAIKTVHVIPQE